MPTKDNAYSKKLDYNNSYNRKNYRSFSIRYHTENEKEIIEWLASRKELKSYVTSLVEADMKKKLRRKKRLEQKKEESKR